MEPQIPKSCIYLKQNLANKIYLLGSENKIKDCSLQFSVRFFFTKKVVLNF